MTWARSRCRPTTSPPDDDPSSVHGGVAHRRADFCRDHPDSFYESASRRALPQLDYVVDRNFRLGDRFRRDFELATALRSCSHPGRKAKLARARAGCWRHDRAGKERHWAYYFKDGKRSAGYYDDQGDSLAGFSCTRRFGCPGHLGYTHRRYHPILHYFRPHLAIDYAAPRAPGPAPRRVIEYAGWKGDYAAISASAQFHLHHHLRHLSRYASGIKRGARVKQDKSSATWQHRLATGDHLCYRILKNGKSLNPLKFKVQPDRRSPTPRISPHPPRPPDQAPEHPRGRFFADSDWPGGS